MKNLMLILLVGILLATVGVGAVSADHHAVSVSTKDGIGRYLADAHGRTLYWFKLDHSGESACNGGCLEKWSVYYREKVAPPKDINAGDFGFITRPDGRNQTTFRGYPLYYFFKDSQPGDTFGQGVKGVWFVIDPAGFPMRK